MSNEKIPFVYIRYNGFHPNNATKAENSDRGEEHYLVLDYIYPENSLTNLKNCRCNIVSSPFSDTSRVEKGWNLGVILSSFYPPSLRKQGGLPGKGHGNNYGVCRLAPIFDWVCYEIGVLARGRVNKGRVRHQWNFFI